MTELSDLFADVFADLEGVAVPAIPASLDGCGNEQVIDNASASRVSRSSRVENEGSGQKSDQVEKNCEIASKGSRETRSFVEGAGNAGIAGIGVKDLAGSTTSLFPQKENGVGSAGIEIRRPAASILDLNRAGPQRSDWLNEDTLSALAPQLAPVAPAVEFLPISAVDVRAGIERELRALVVLDRTGAEALRDAIEITRAKVRNAPALAELQIDGGRCHVCEGVLDDALPVIAILTGKSGAHLFLHSGCHDEHSRRVSALVDRIMAAAGYGADEPTGAAL